MSESLFDCSPRASEMDWNWKRIKLTMGIADIPIRMITYDSMLVGYLVEPSDSSTINESFMVDF